MLPAIDMINHATEPDRRNTLLRKSSAEMTVKVDGAPLTLHGFFTMKAGQPAPHHLGTLSFTILPVTHLGLELPSVLAAVLPWTCLLLPSCWPDCRLAGCC